VCGLPTLKIKVGSAGALRPGSDATITRNVLPLLAVAAAAVLAGARSIAAIAEWAADAPQPVRAALGARQHAPDHFAVPAEATILRTLRRLDSRCWPG
jgi:hypothetical protein